MTRLSRQYLLSFVTDETGKYLAIHVDLRGAKMLIDELEGIKRQLESNDCPHTHLFGYSPTDKLTTTKLSDQENEVNIVGHVKIYGWNEEWSRRHGLKPLKE